MTRKFLIINAALLLLMLLAGGRLVRTLTHRYNGNEGASDNLLTGGGGGDSVGALRAKTGRPENYGVIQDADVFRKEREGFLTPTPPPVTITPTPPGTPIPPPKGLKLNGVMGTGTDRVAFISESSIDKGSPMPYRVGSLIAKLNLRIDAINARQVMLTGPNGPVTLEMLDFTAQGTPDPRATYNPTNRTNPFPFASPTPSNAQANTSNNNPFPLLQKAIEDAKRAAERNGRGGYGEEDPGDWGDNNDRDEPPPPPFPGIGGGNQR